MHAVLFDIDGTLIDSRGAGRAALAAAFHENFGQADIQNVPISGRTDRAIARDLFCAHEVEDSHENWQRLAAGYLQHLPEQLLRRGGRVLPGVGELLAALGQRPRVLVGLLTGNTPGGARLKLAHYRILQHFGFGAYGDVHLERDAVAAEALRQARSRNGGELHPRRVLVIGDTPLDIRCARHIGAQAIAVATGLHPRDELAALAPDVLLDDLADVPAVLRLLDE